MLRDRHAESCVATIEAEGATRAREAVEKLLKHPMLDDGRALTEADTVLVSLMGGPDLTMADVNRVMEQVNRQCDQAKVLMGAAIDEAFRGRLAVTIIASRPISHRGKAQPAKGNRHPLPKRRSWTHIFWIGSRRGARLRGSRRRRRCCRRSSRRRSLRGRRAGSRPGPNHGCGRSSCRWRL